METKNNNTETAAGAPEASQKNEKPEQPDGRLIGKHFFSIENKKPKWQGIVIGQPQPGFYLVQLFDWLMGKPGVQKLVPIAEMRTWFFYENADEMCDGMDAVTTSNDWTDNTMLPGD
jgi:hypothetical protein